MRGRHNKICRTYTRKVVNDDIDTDTVILLYSKRAITICTPHPKRNETQDEVGVGVEAGSTQGRGARKKEVKKKHKPHTGRDVWKERSKERGSREER